MQPTPRLPAQPPLANSGCRRLPCFSAVGSYRRARNLRVLIVDLFFLPVMLPSVLPKLGTDSAVRRFPGVGNFSLLKTPFPGWNSIPPSFVSLSFIFFPTSFRRLGLLFWVPDVLCQHSEVVLWNLLGV